MLHFCVFRKEGTAHVDAASRTDDRKQLSDEQWLIIAGLFPRRPPSECGGWPVVPPRAVLEALLWLLRIGGRWQDLADGAPSESTCRRRLRKWVETGQPFEGGLGVIVAKRETLGKQ